MKIQVFFAILLTFTFTPVAMATADDGIAHIYPGLYDTGVVFAVHAINQHKHPQESGDVPVTATRIISATVQVSSDVTYRYQIEVTNETTTEYCNVTVYSQPWLPAPNLDAGPVTCVADQAGLVGKTGATSEPHSTSFQGARPSHDTTVAPTSYPPLQLTDDEKSALLYFVESFNAPRSVQWRYIPYDVTVERTISRTPPFGIDYMFSFRMVSSKCTKPDMSIFGKITLNDCPPLRDSYLRYEGPKCEARVIWDPTNRVQPYTYMDYSCPRSNNKK